MSPVFTPLNESRTERLRFNRDDVQVLSGNLMVRGRGKKARVSINGKQYDVYGISCGLPNCACDAYVKELV